MMTILARSTAYFAKPHWKETLGTIPPSFDGSHAVSGSNIPAESQKVQSQRPSGNVRSPASSPHAGHDSTSRSSTSTRTAASSLRPRRSRRLGLRRYASSSSFFSPSAAPANRFTAVEKPIPSAVAMRSMRHRSSSSVRKRTGRTTCTAPRAPSPYYFVLQDGEDANDERPRLASHYVLCVHRGDRGSRSLRQFPSREVSPSGGPTPRVRARVPFAFSVTPHPREQLLRSWRGPNSHPDAPSTTRSRRADGRRREHRRSSSPVRRRSRRPPGSSAVGRRARAADAGAVRSGRRGRRQR